VCHTLRVRALAIVVLVAGSAHAGVDLTAVTKTAPGCDPSRAHCFGIQLHVAVDADLVAPPDWIATQVSEANRLFAPLDIGFRLVGVDALPASAFHIANRGDRDELASHRAGGTLIDVFVIGKLDDIDEAGAIAYGVTWRIKDERKYILVSNAAMPRTLAHELGHFFGLPHSTYKISIMNKKKRDDPPPEQRTFAPQEFSTMRDNLKRMLRDKIVADVKSAQ
jgi:hypothetical protein